jgi:tetratricopeptide (TPR) repeat protein
MILGDLQRVDTLLAQASALDPTSADLAYRRARVLEDLDEIEVALLEYCRARDLNIADLGVTDVPRRIVDLSAEVRERLPDAARLAFVDGLSLADSALYASAVTAFTTAAESAPEWGAPVFNRGLMYEQLGMFTESLSDYRTYLQLSPTEVDPIVMLASERIGLLEGVAAMEPPSPVGALALGVVPGMGHYYTGRGKIGTLTLLAAGTSVATGFLVKKVTTICVDAVAPGEVCPSELVFEEQTQYPYLAVGLGVAAAVTLVGAIEAYVKARARKQEAESMSSPVRDEGPTLLFPSVTGRGGQVDFNLLRMTLR